MSAFDALRSTLADVRPGDPCAIDRMPGNAAGRRKLRRYLERHYAALDIEQYHDCMVVKLPKGFKYDLDFLIRRQAGRFTDIDLRALILDNPTVGPTGEDLKAANLVPNPFNTYPAHNFFVQAAAAEAMTQVILRRDHYNCLTRAAPSAFLRAFMGEPEHGALHSFRTQPRRAR